jgi:hypothetical protein
VDKVLILGCSFSAGSYVPKMFSGNILGDKLDDHIGWPFFVDHLEEKDVTIIACPSQGYWTYYQILLFLEEENKLNYDEIWIQENASIRASILDIELLTKMFKNPDFVLNNRKLIYVRMKEEEFLFKCPSSYNEKKVAYWKDFYLKMGEACALNIDKLCEEKNIKGYVWAWYYPIMQCKHFTRLNLGHMPNILGEKKLINFGQKHGSGGHQTEEGNKYIGELINNEMG